MIRAKIRNIPGLDGLRAISISIVIVAHSSWYLPQWLTDNILFRAVIGSGAHGVAIFFVISGYLITTLLLRELSTTNSISLRRFYLRRSVRIFPAYYVFLSVMAFLWLTHAIPEHLASFIAAATYMWTFYPAAQGYFIYHAWSLSIEEIFYIVWPLLIGIAYRQRSLSQISLTFILVMPLVRLLFYFIFPTIRGNQLYMLQGWIDTIVVGCLLAILTYDRKPIAQLQFYSSGLAAGFLGLVAFVIVPIVKLSLSKRIGGVISLLFEPSLLAFSIGSILLYCVSRACFINRFGLKLVTSA